MDFLDYKTILVILHILGVALGAGGAYLSDSIFFSSIQDEKFSSTEIRFIQLSSKIVWLGLVLLFLSGILMFLTSPAYYLASSKFMAKMFVVLILTINGIFFHLAHIPRIIRHQGSHFPSSDEFIRLRFLLLINGAISVTSWTFALVLGALRVVPFSVVQILSFYFAVIILACLFAYLIRSKLIPDHNKN